MKLKDFIAALKDVDDDVLEYEVGIRVEIRIHQDCIIGLQSFKITVPENVDVKNKVLLLQGK